MRREFFTLSNANETQRSSATQADGSGESENSIILELPAQSDGRLHRPHCGRR